MKTLFHRPSAFKNYLMSPFLVKVIRIQLYNVCLLALSQHLPGTGMQG
jgi:hypothetical protein